MEIPSPKFSRSTTLIAASFSKRVHPLFSSRLPEFLLATRNLNEDWWYRRANRRISPDAEDPYTELDYNDIGAHISELWPLVTWCLLKLNQPLFIFHFFAKYARFRKNWHRARQARKILGRVSFEFFSLYLWKLTTAFRIARNCLEFSFFKRAL